MMESEKKSEPHEEIMKVFESADDPVLTAPEVADAVGVSRVTANKRLKQLGECGALERKKVGGRAVVWWIPGAL